MCTSNTRLTSWAVLAVGLTVQSAALATDRFYCDLTAVSPSQRYLLTAKQTRTRREAAGEHPGTVWPNGFEYVLTDAQTKRAVWTRPQAPGESPPIDAFATDDRRAIIWTDDAGGRLIFLGADGRETARMDVLSELFTAEEREAYVVPTSAGPSWGSYHAYLLTKAEATFFVIRTAWDRRIVIDVDAAQPVKPAAGLDAAMDDEEKRFALNVLKKVPKSDPYDVYRLDDRERRSMFLAIHLAGRLHTMEAVSSLRGIEAVSNVTGSSNAHGLTSAGEKSNFNWLQCGFRRASQVALRRLGEKPRLLPALYLTESGKSGKDQYVGPLTLPRRTERRVGQLRAGATLNEILDLLGTPEYAVFGFWRYEIDADPPYTLMLAWRDGRVRNIQKKTPPLWQSERRCEGDFVTESNWIKDLASTAEEWAGKAPDQIATTAAASRAGARLPVSAIAANLEWIGIAVSEPDYTIWGAAPIQDDDGNTHLFVARWPEPNVDPAWRKSSEIAHYVASRPTGPFEFKEVVIRGTGRQGDWDAYAPCNPEIKKFGDTYALLYVANSDYRQPPHPLNQSIGMMVSKSLDGPWRKVGEDGLILDDSPDPTHWTHGMQVVNPAIIQFGDKFLLYFKSRVKGHRGSVYAVATSEKLEGPYRLPDQPLTDRDVTIEDGSVFEWDGKVCLLTTDNHGQVTGIRGGGALWISEDGRKFNRDWTQVGYDRIPAYFKEYDPQNVKRVYGGDPKLERPKVLLLADRPAYLYAPSGWVVHGGQRTACYVLRINLPEGANPVPGPQNARP